MEPGPPGVLFDPVVPLFMEPLCMSPFSLPMFEPAVGFPGPELCPVGPEPPPPAAAPPPAPPPLDPCASANAGASAMPAANVIVTSLICILPFRFLTGDKRRRGQ